MASFVINGTEFGIDRERSRCTVSRSLFRGPRLSVELHGDQGNFDRAREGEEWSWALYPPSFSLRAVAVPKPKGGQGITVRLSPEDVERHEVGLYMMEHNPVKEVVVRLRPGSEVTISGEVDLCGEPGEFRIEWTS